jgi:hypothetical protein
MPWIAGLIHNDLGCYACAPGSSSSRLHRRCEARMSRPNFRQNPQFIALACPSRHGGRVSVKLRASDLFHPAIIVRFRVRNRCSAICRRCPACFPTVPCPVVRNDRAIFVPSFCDWRPGARRRTASGAPDVGQVSRLAPPQCFCWSLSLDKPSVCWLIPAAMA